MTTLESLLMQFIPIAAGFYTGFKHSRRALIVIPVLIVGLLAYSLMWVLLFGDFSAGFDFIGALLATAFLMFQNVVSCATAWLIGFAVHAIRAGQRQAA